MFDWHYAQKFKLRKTGETVFIVGANGENDKRRKTDWVSYIDSSQEEHVMERGLNLYWDFIPTKDYEHERTIENHLCVFAGMAMTSYMRSKSPNNTDGIWQEEDIQRIARKAADYGEALCIELGKRDLQKLVKKCYTNREGKS